MVLVIMMSLWMAGELIRNGSLANIRRLPFFLGSEPLYMAGKVKELLFGKGCGWAIGVDGIRSRFGLEVRGSWEDEGLACNARFIS
jgi:hypothetical protein